MAKESFGQSRSVDDVDDTFEEEYDEYEEGEFLLKGGQSSKKGPLPSLRKKGDQFSDSPSKKRRKDDAKSRYLRKHRDDVNW
jgi:hypothetical protein